LAAWLQYQATQLASGPRGALDATASSPFGDIGAKTRFKLAGDQLQLTRLSARADGARASGDVTVNLASTQAEGQFKLDVTDLGRAAQPFGVQAGGNGGGTVRLTPGRQGQGIRLAMKFAVLNGFGFDVAKVRVTANGGLDGAQPIKVELTANGVKSDAVSLDRVGFRLDGPLRDAAVRLDANGNISGQLLKADISGRLAVLEQS
jgi:hypothetical protein